MGKKRHRSSYTSKGERPNVKKSTLKLVARDRSPFWKEENLRKAWKAGKNPWITVPNDQSNAPTIKKRANAIWGNPKKSIAY